VLAAGLMMAMLSERLFMVQQDAAFASQVQLTWDCNWQDFVELYANSTQCSVDINALNGPINNWCQANESSAVVMHYHSIYYDMPLLQIGGAYQSRMQHLFPKGDVFHSFVRHLVEPSVAVRSAADMYASQSEQCLVGVQIRSMRAFPGSPQQYVDLHQYANITAGIAQLNPGNIFIAADTDLFHDIAQLLPGRVVWWNNLTQSTLTSARSAGGNPGSDVSAMADILLLASCQHLVITAGSSFGALAAAWGGLHAVHVTRGLHEKPFYTPWFWVSMTSEPCMFKMSPIWGGLHAVTRQALRQHPLYLYHEQCN
jgi:hypothetical protein